jgi:hypothetical protein
MLLIIYCHDDGPFWQVNAASADLDKVHAAMAGEPCAPFRFTARTTPDGKDAERIIRSGAIRSVDAGQD